MLTEVDSSSGTVRWVFKLGILHSLSLLLVVPFIVGIDSAPHEAKMTEVSLI